MGHTTINIKYRLGGIRHRLAGVPPLLYVPTANENSGEFFTLSASVQKMFSALIMLLKSTRLNLKSQGKNYGT